MSFRAQPGEERADPRCLLTLSPPPGQILCRPPSVQTFCGPALLAH